MDGMSVIQRVQLSGTITTQPMFSGVGYFIDGAMFGIDFDGLFYVKGKGEWCSDTTMQTGRVAALRVSK
ncbi:TfoX/Sxy family protein [Vibrio mediterranei]|nr:TfoX/Sxy family protein [Vibrio mediterranei]